MNDLVNLAQFEEKTESLCSLRRRLPERNRRLAVKRQGVHNLRNVLGGWERSGCRGNRIRKRDKRAELTVPVFEYLSGSKWWERSFLPPASTSISALLLGDHCSAFAPLVFLHMMQVDKKRFMNAEEGRIDQHGFLILPAA